MSGYIVIDFYEIQYKIFDYFPVWTTFRHRYSSHQNIHQPYYPLWIVDIIIIIRHRTSKENKKEDSRYTPFPTQNSSPDSTSLSNFKIDNTPHT